MFRPFIPVSYTHLDVYKRQIIDHVKKSYGDKEVLRDISFSFESGKIYGLLGRNGAGKTTLFNCLNRDLTCDAGSFYFETETGRREVAAEDIGYVLLSLIHI